MSEKMGRPEIEIDWGQFEKLCKMQATKEEIAGWFDCHFDTINNRCKKKYGETFSAINKKKSASGKISLRRAMFKKAISQENTAMQIWLSKQCLGMKEPNILDYVKTDQTIDFDFEIVK